MRQVKDKLLHIAEIVLDAILDNIIPYRLLSKTGVRNVSVPLSIKLHYVFNQKFQRMQLLNLLEEKGTTNPAKFKIWWSRGLSNFGDEILSYLLANIAGVDCVYDRGKSFIGIGSTVRFAQDYTKIWGSGVIKETETMTNKPQCLAVRGPITRDKMIECGVSCPEIYGDPAMLFPLFYTPKKIETSSKAIIVPHFKHIDIIAHHDEFDYLDLRVKSIGEIENVINHLVSYDSVITSSLHGFIFCVAYGIPVSLFKLEQRNIGGDDVKFKDFCLGVGIETPEITAINDNDLDVINDLAISARVYEHSWSPIPLLEGLRKACPTPVLEEFIEKVSDSRAG